jgi:hypothetical protein
MSLGRTSALFVALAVGSLTISATIPAQSTPPAWTPPAALSPLRQIWSFDTKG